MRPVYSRNACFPCKRRKKKCSERKPVCDACARLKIICSYTDPGVVRQNRSVILEVNEIREQSPSSPLALVQTLRAVIFRNGAEESVVHRAPQFLLSFWSIASNEETRDLKVFLQMILQQDLVRNAAVSCLSGMLDRGNQYKDLYYTSYGRSLNCLRLTLSHTSIENTLLSCILTALTFIGLSESTGPDPTGNLFLHWDALLTLLGRTNVVDDKGQLKIPRILYLWVLEGALYHLSRIGMFSAKFLPSVEKWHRESFYRKLVDANPDPTSRALHSPLMNGQYALSKMILDVVHLHRTQRPGATPSGRLDALEEELKQYEASLKDQFQTLSLQNRRTLSSKYRVSYNSLRICIHALREPSLETGEAIDLVASENLALLLSLPMVETNHFGLTWAIQILACALRTDDAFGSLKEYYQKFKLCLDPGHGRRGELLFARVERLKRESRNALHARQTAESPTRFFPTGLSLLQNRNGILS